MVKLVSLYGTGVHKCHVFIIHHLYLAYYITNLDLQSGRDLSQVIKSGGRHMRDYTLHHGTSVHFILKGRSTMSAFDLLVEYYKLYIDHDIQCIMSQYRLVTLPTISISRG